MRRKTYLAIAIVMFAISALCGWALVEGWAGCVCDDDTTTVCAVQKDKDGRMTVWTETTRDDQGRQIQRREDAYAYCPNGDVHTITQRVFGPGDKKTAERTVEHFPDKQPVATTIQAVEKEAGKIK